MCSDFRISGSFDRVSEAADLPHNESLFMKRKEPIGQAGYTYLTATLVGQKGAKCEHCR